MKIELTKEDCQNVQIALTLLAKSPQTSANDMKVALILGDKFIFREAAITPKEEHVDGNSTIPEGKTSNQPK